MQKYTDPEKNKSRIYRENKKKSGIYRWTNRINGHSYIGRSKDLGNRFWLYFSKKSMRNNLKTSRSFIYSALLEHDYSSFELEILEYCDEEKIKSREKYYIDLYDPEYNIKK